MSKQLEESLQIAIECHDAQLTTTPHLSRIRHAAAELLRLMKMTDAEVRAYEKERSSVYTLRDRIVGALGDYEKGTDHVPGHMGDDCIYCKACNAVGRAPSRRRG